MPGREMLVQQMIYRRAADAPRRLGGRILVNILARAERALDCGQGRLAEGRKSGGSREAHFFQGVFQSRRHGEDVARVALGRQQAVGCGAQGPLVRIGGHDERLVGPSRHRSIRAEIRGGVENRGHHPVRRRLAQAIENRQQCWIVAAADGLQHPQSQGLVGGQQAVNGCCDRWGFMTAPERFDSGEARHADGRIARQLFQQGIVQAMVRRHQCFHGGGAHGGFLGLQQAEQHPGQLRRQLAGELANEDAAHGGRGAGHQVFDLALEQARIAARCQLQSQTLAVLVAAAEESADVAVQLRRHNADGILAIVQIHRARAQHLHEPAGVGAADKEAAHQEGDREQETNRRHRALGDDVLEHPQPGARRRHGQGIHQTVVEDADAPDEAVRHGVVVGDEYRRIHTVGPGVVDRVAEDRRRQ